MHIILDNHHYVFFQSLKVTFISQIALAKNECFSHCSAKSADTVLLQDVSEEYRNYTGCTHKVARYRNVGSKNCFIIQSQSKL